MKSFGVVKTFDVFSNGLDSGLPCRPKEAMHQLLFEFVVETFHDGIVEATSGLGHAAKETMTLKKSDGFCPN